MEKTVVKYRSQLGVTRGVKVAEHRNGDVSLVLIEYPVKVTKVPKAETRHIVELGYPLAKANKVLVAMAKRFYGGLRHVPKNLRAALEV